KNGKMSDSLSSKDLKNVWQRENNQLACFVADCCCTLDANSRVKTADLFKKYYGDMFEHGWARSNGYEKRFNVTNFSRNMAKLGEKLGFRKIMNNGSWFEGIRLLNESEEI